MNMPVGVSAAGTRQRNVNLSPEQVKKYSARNEGGFVRVGANNSLMIGNRFWVNVPAGVLENVLKAEKSVLGIIKEQMSNLCLRYIPEDVKAGVYKDKFPALERYNREKSAGSTPHIMFYQEKSNLDSGGTYSWYGVLKEARAKDLPIQPEKWRAGLFEKIFAPYQRQDLGYTNSSWISNRGSEAKKVSKVLTNHLQEFIVTELDRELKGSTISWEIKK